MTEIPLTLTHQPSSKGSNSHSLSHNSVFGYSSPPRIEHDISYQHLHSVRPITHQFVKAVIMISGIQYLQHESKKLKSTPIAVVVSSVKEEVLNTGEALE